MSSYFELPKGFLASGVTCGIKATGKDLGLLVSQVDASCAAVFTTNAIKAAPVKVSMERVGRGFLRGVVVNSGNANACTGDRGVKDALSMCEKAEKELGLREGSFLVSSTGVIGSFLPMERVLWGIERASSALTPSSEDFAEAIMTTDTFPKVYAVDVGGGRRFKVWGCAKGAGMINPRMATMLAFIATDVFISPSMLSMALKEGVEESFNRIMVDGDTSTNDMVVLFSNGVSGIGGEGYEDFKEALKEVCIKLSEMIVKDGEGASKLVRVWVKGARSQEDARAAAEAISRSLLVKTAFFGEDPNWGRIVAAVGYSGAEVVEELIKVYIGGNLVFDGIPVPSGEDGARRAMKNREFDVVVDLGLGEWSWKVVTTDLSYEYVKINAEYRT